MPVLFERQAVTSKGIQFPAKLLQKCANHAIKLHLPEMPPKFRSFATVACNSADGKVRGWRVSYRSRGLEGGRRAGVEVLVVDTGRSGPR